MQHILSELNILLAALIITFLVQTLQISTKSTAQFLSNRCLKNGAQKKKFPIWKSRLSSSYAIPSVTVCAQSNRHLHRHLHQSAAEVGPVLNKTSPCQEIFPTTFWHCNPYLLCLKTLISIPASLVKTIAFYAKQTRHKM